MTTEQIMQTAAWIIVGVVLLQLWRAALNLKAAAARMREAALPALYTLPNSAGVVDLTAVSWIHHSSDGINSYVHINGVTQPLVLTWSEAHGLEQALRERRERLNQGLPALAESEE